MKKSFGPFQALAILAMLLVAGYRPASAQAPPDVQFLHAFTGGAAGADPVSTVIQTPNGSLAGVTFGVGNDQNTPGYLYTVSPTGQFTIIHTFPASGSEGGIRNRFESSSIMQASDQIFYGTFPSLGIFYAGTVYRVTPSGVFKLIHDFHGDGFDPMGPLVEAFDGNLYGVTYQGYVNGLKSPGTIFRVGLDGTFTYVFDFGTSNVLYPSGGLTLGPDGNLYGVANNAIYRFDPLSDTVTSLFTINEGEEISSVPPVVGANGRLYFSSMAADLCACPFGSILSFGLDGSGPVFEFLFTEVGTGGTTSLTLAGSGDFYSFKSPGTYFNLEDVSLSAQKVSAYTLQGTGTPPSGNPTQISNGEIAGTTYSGGDNGKAAGSLFLVNTGEPKPVPFILGFRPETASAGQTVTLWGNHFIGTTSVAVGGVPAAFRVTASGFVSFTVPEAAKSGLITVTNAGGTTASSATLSVQE